MMLGGTAPILILIALGFLSRALGLLRAGDERALNGFVYFFALPAFLLLNLSRTSFTLESLKFMGAGLVPIAALLGAYFLIRRAGGGKELFYLLTTSTVFGSLAFFGVPYIEYVLGPGEPERLAALIIAIALGASLSLAEVSLPRFLAQSLSYLSSATAPVALFSLGVFLYGRSYRSFVPGLGLSALRLLILPGITFLVAWALRFSALERDVLVFMNGTPIAVNMIVLSQRYRYYPELIGTVVFVSSLGSILTLSLWRWILS